MMNPLTKGRRLVRRWSDRWRRGAFILMYHRVDEPEDDPFRLCVRPGRFAEQLAVLRERWNVVSLAQLARSLAAGDTVEGCVALTFDDGYEDNLRVALPALERADVPATVFVVSDRLGREFWWDRFTRLWATRRGSTGTDAFRSAHRKLRGLDAEPREEALARLADEAAPDAGVAGADGMPPRALTQEELCRLAASDLVEIGSHTRTHPFLPDLDEARQREEIVGARAVLEELTDRPVSSLSYPYGGFDRVSVALAEEAADCACAAVPGVCTAGSGTHVLPRFFVGDWSGDALDDYLRARSPGSAPPAHAAR